MRNVPPIACSFRLIYPHDALCLPFIAQHQLERPILYEKLP
jgi:hypothetical protein